jgi:predicted small lipoprotein YifL
MKSFSIVVALLFTFVFIAGCGQRGPLVLPKPPEPLSKPEVKTPNKNNP